MNVSTITKLGVAMSLFALCFSEAGAQNKRDVNPVAPEIFRQLIDCRRETDSAARLACYDLKVEALDEATRKREVVISDKHAVQEAQRGLFGFATPVAKLMGFGGNADETEELKEVTTSVASARHTQAGWLLELADGSSWEQNDTRDFIMSPKVGNSARISRGALGTFTVSIQGQRAIKMRRVR